jgi:hypothetical protein
MAIKRLIVEALTMMLFLFKNNAGLITINTQHLLLFILISLKVYCFNFSTINLAVFAEAPGFPISKSSSS